VVSRFLRWGHEQFVAWTTNQNGEKRMTDNITRGHQAAQEVAQRWITTMQSMANSDPKAAADLPGELL
jgi:hypothetical protein